MSPPVTGVYVCVCLCVVVAGMLVLRGTRWFLYFVCVDTGEKFKSFSFPVNRILKLA